MAESRLEQLYIQAVQAYQQSGVASGKLAHEKVRQVALGSLYDIILTGLLYAVEERFEEALAAYDQALAIGFDSYKIVYLLKSDALARLSRFDEAVAALDGGIACAPGNLAFYETKAIFQLEFHQLDEVIGTYDDILRRRARAIEILFFKSLAFFLIGQTQEAWGVQQQLLSLLPDTSKMPIFQKNMQTHLGQYAKLIDDHLRISPDQADAWYFKGMISFVSCDFSEQLSAVLVFFEKAIHFAPTHAWAWNGKGMVLVALNKYREGTLAFAEAVSLAPTIQEFAQNRSKAARVVEGPSLPPTAIYGKRRKKKGKRNSGDQPFSSRELPSLERLEQLMNEGRLDEALRACGQLLAFAQQGRGGLNLEAILWLKARLLLDLERPDETVETYRELLRRDPAHPHARDELAELLVANRRFAEALELLPAHSVVDGGDERLYEKRAGLLLVLGRDQEALENAQRIHALNPKNLLAYLIRSTALRQMGRKEEALNVCEEALREVSSQGRALPVLFLWKADMLLALARPREALPIYEEALRREAEHRMQPLDDEMGVLMEGFLYDQFVGDIFALIYSGMGNAWLLLENGERALEYYDQALALGSSREIEENRQQALSLLHDTTARSSASLVAERSFERHQSEAFVQVGVVLWYLVRWGTLVVTALLLVSIASLLHFGVAFISLLPTWLVVTFDLLLCILYPVSCWYGWMRPLYERSGSLAMNSNLQKSVRGIERVRKAAFSGGVYVGLTALLLLILDTGRGVPSNDWVNPVVLNVWRFLFLIHVVTWGFLKVRRIGARRAH